VVWFSVQDASLNPTRSEVLANLDHTPSSHYEFRLLTTKIPAPTAPEQASCLGVDLTKTYRYSKIFPQWATYLAGMSIFVSPIVVVCGGRVKRLIGGSNTGYEEQTFMVSMQAKIVTERWFGIPIAYKRSYCGGTIIHDRWVLTAGHCFAL